MLKSAVCRCEHFTDPWFARWAGVLCFPNPKAPLNERWLHRKAWEYCSIAQALDERGMLVPGKVGIGFAVGREPLVSLFAALGAGIVATDISQGQTADLWKVDNQYAGNKDGLFFPNLIERRAFDARVEYRHADMRDLSQFDKQSFDFVWSACALEHLGSLEAGLTFIRESACLLKKEGVAVHTTEYNVSSNEETLSTGPTVIYRQQDLRALELDLSTTGFGLEHFDFYHGRHQYDLEPDREPWGQDGRKHVKLELAGFVATSVLMIIRSLDTIREGVIDA